MSILAPLVAAGKSPSQAFTIFFIFRNPFELNRVGEFLQIAMRGSGTGPRLHCARRNMSSRFYFAALWLAGAAYAGPPLTTIQDVLYKADGTRFSGVLTIGWSSFQAVDNSSIVMQSTTIKVVDGN